MSKEKKNTQNEKRKLSRQERKQIDTLIRQAKGDGKPCKIRIQRALKEVDYGVCNRPKGLNKNQKQGNV